jgi:hypothetical protein
MRTAAAGGARQADTPAAACLGQQQQHADRCGSSVPAGRSCMCALWGPPRQSVRRRRGVCVPFVGHMHPRKCVACVVFCRMQRERVRRVGRAVGAGVQMDTTSGHPGAQLSDPCSFFYSLSLRIKKKTLMMVLPTTMSRYDDDESQAFGKDDTRNIRPSLSSGFSVHRCRMQKVNNDIICFRFSSSSKIDVHVSSLTRKLQFVTQCLCQ